MKKLKKSNIIALIISGILYVSLLIFFTIMCLQTGSESSQSSNRVAKLVQSILNTLFNAHIELTDTYLTVIRKLIGHFGYFLVLGITSIIFYLNLPIKLSLRISLHYIVALIFAFFSEFALEGSTSGRSASIKDVCIDYSGFIFVSTIILIIYLLNVKKLQKVSSKY